MAGALGGLLGNTILAIVIGIYWLTSRDETIDFTLRLFPIGRRALIEAMITEIEQSLGAYVRGVTLVSLFVGCANFVFAAAAGAQPDAAGVHHRPHYRAADHRRLYWRWNPHLLALLDYSPAAAILTLVSFVLVQQVENHYLTPRVMSDDCHISPILVIVALFIGFSVGGVIGALVAVPIAGTLMVLTRNLMLDSQ